MLARTLVSFLFVLSIGTTAKAQYTYAYPHPDSIDNLLSNLAIQLAVTDAVDALYNFDFLEARSTFKWLRNLYSEHPLPYFLLGLSYWWQIMPDIENEEYDPGFLSYMDSTIYYGERRVKKRDNYDPESAFLISGAYAFKGRLFSDRQEWTAAAFQGKRSLNWLEESKADSVLSPELMLGDGLYNYYSIWIRENYKSLRPIMWFFPAGDKELGIKQLEEVSQESFYSRIEALLFLSKIYADEQKPQEALRISTYLHEQYPNNPYFHRMYVQRLFMMGKLDEASKESAIILDRIDRKEPGYEANSGRFASFYQGYQLYRSGRRKESKEYFTKVRVFANQNDKEDAGYSLAALKYLYQIAEGENNQEEQLSYAKEILDLYDKKDPLYKNARVFIRRMKRKGKE